MDRLAGVNLGRGGAQPPREFAIAPFPEDFTCLILNVIGTVT